MQYWNVKTKKALKVSPGTTVIRAKSVVNFKAWITISEIQDKEEKNTKLYISFPEPIPSTTSKVATGFWCSCFNQTLAK